MRYCILASGSKGNSIFIETDHVRVLIDVGLTARQIETRLKSIDVAPETINAIVLTHDHNDHVRGVGVFARRFGVPVYGHPETLDNITYLFRGQETLQPWMQDFTIADLHFTPFPLSHDSIPTVGYTITHQNRRLVICTDLGVVTPVVKEQVARANALLLESNHDPELLMRGPYPWHLKERIASRVGHLSNHNAGVLLREVLNGGIQRVILGHLSEENNRPELALETVLDYVGHSFREHLSVIEQKTISPMYQL